MDIIVISLTSPLLVGIYEDSRLIDKHVTKEQTSEALPAIFEKILKKYTCRRVFFAKGPGSFMAIKITYIFLRTLQIAQNIELFASDGFNFNNNCPIKAMGKLYFVKKDGKIETEFFKNEPMGGFDLPKLIKLENFTKEIEPLYILPAV